MNTPYRIKYEPDELFCDGRDFIMCSHDIFGVTLFVRHGVRDLPDEQNARVWEEAWAAFRELTDKRVPRQRIYAAS